MNFIKKVMKGECQEMRQIEVDEVPRDFYTQLYIMHSDILVYFVITPFTKPHTVNIIVIVLPFWRMQMLKTCPSIFY